MRSYPKALVAVLMGAGCSSAAIQDSKPAVEATETLRLSGSSTLAPLISAIGQRFEEEPSVKVRIQVSAGGSSRGISDLRQGTSEIGMISRALNDAESDLQGYRVAGDGVCLIVHRDNPISSLTDEQVVAVYSGGLNNWKQLGGLDSPIHPLIRAEGRSEAELFLKFYNLSKDRISVTRTALGDTDRSIAAVIGDPNAVTYVSLGEAERRVRDGAPIRLLPVRGIAASSENIRAGVFPLSRPLMLVVKGAPTPAVERFIRYCLSPSVKDLVAKMGFVPNPG